MPVVVILEARSPIDESLPVVDIDIFEDFNCILLLSKIILSPDDDTSNLPLPFNITVESGLLLIVVVVELPSDTIKLS